MFASLRNRLRKIFGPPGSHERGWRILLAATVSAALFVTVAFSVQWIAGMSHPAVAAVRDYLTAVQQKDVVEALNHVDGLPGNATMLVPEALNENWSVLTIEFVGDTDDNIQRHVAAGLAGPDGQHAVGVYEVNRVGDGSWRLADPFVTVEFGRYQPRTVGVNGFPLPDYATGYSSAYLLFPGLYSFNDVDSVLFDNLAETQLVASGSVRVNGGDISPVLGLSTAGHERLQESVNDLVDTCAEDAVLLAEGCPFGAIDVTSEQGEELTDVDDITWTVMEYPEVTANQWLTIFIVSDRRAGVVQLEGVGIDESGGTVEFVMECAIRASSLMFAIGDDDEITLIPEDSEKFRIWDTCRNH